MKVLALVPFAAAAMLMAPSPAHAQAKFELGGRLGYGIPLGDASGGEGDNSLSEGIAGQVPIWLDVGARLTPNIFVGGYLGLGIGISGDQLADLCDGIEAQNPDVDCSLSAMDVRLGAQVQYHFAPGGTDPWIGAGFGYEIVSWGYSLEAGDQEQELTLSASGFEFLNLQGGVDFPIGEKVGIGPFAAFTLAQYSDLSVDCSGECNGVTDDVEGEIEDKALHEWLFLGARLTLVL